MATISALAGIIVAVAAYPIIGIAMYASSVLIYDKFPEEFRGYPPDPEEKLLVRVQNNAPMSLPLINPFYTLHVVVEAENDAFAYFEGLGGKKRNFTEYSIDLGRIDSGDSEESTIILHVDESDLTLRIDVYLWFGFQIKSSSATYSVEYLGDHEYAITKMG